jgi:hypothetical protein
MVEGMLEEDNIFYLWLSEMRKVHSALCTGETFSSCPRTGPEINPHAAGPCQKDMSLPLYLINAGLIQREGALSQSIRTCDLFFTRWRGTMALSPFVG